MTLLMQSQCNTALVRHKTCWKLLLDCKTEQLYQAQAKLFTEVTASSSKRCSHSGLVTWETGFKQKLERPRRAEGGCSIARSPGPALKVLSGYEITASAFHIMNSKGQASGSGALWRAGMKMSFLLNQARRASCPLMWVKVEPQLMPALVRTT